MHLLENNIVEFGLICTKCKQTKPIDSFYRDKLNTAREGRAKHCKDCKAKNRISYDILSDSDPLIVNSIRECNYCKTKKTLSEFRKTKFGKYGRSYYCKNCEDCKGKIYKGTSQYIELRKKNSKKWNYKKSYGMSLEDVKALLNNQLGLCANRACGKEIFIDTDDRKNKAFVDHCHETGKIRGMLCISCNTALGLIEQKNKMLGLTEYLQKYSN